MAEDNKKETSTAPAASPGMKEELVEDEEEERNLKGMIIAIFIIGTICALIVLSIFILSKNNEIDLKSKKIKLKDVAYDGFEMKMFNGSWISDSELIFVDTDGALILYNLGNKYQTIIAPNFTMSQYNVKKFSISNDRKYVLLVHDIRLTRTYSYTAKYKVLDTKTSLVSSLKAPDNSEDLQFAGWGPSSSQLIIIHGNNIFYYARMGDRPNQLTTDGREGYIYNGIPDMMYEEHILKTNLAFWWFNNGSRLCYASFDNSKVDQIPFIIYGPSNLSYESEYPKINTYPYSKPGRVNSHVSLWVVDLTSPNMVRNIRQLDPPRGIKGWEHYITAPIKWISKSKLNVIWSIRSQNMTIISECKEEKNWECEKIFEENLSSSTGFLFVNEGPIYSKDNANFFMRLPVQHGMSGTFRQVAMITSDGTKTYLTRGQFVVTKLIAYRDDMRTLFYVATTQDEPEKRHLYSVGDLASPTPRQITCLSCDVHSQCQYVDATFSPNAKYYILECLGPGIPQYQLRNVKDNSLIEILDTSSRLEQWMNDRNMPKIRYLSVPINEGEYSVRVQLTLPSQVKEDGEVKYPSIVHVNKWPGSQSVSYLHKLDWGTYLASKKDYISIHIDARGSGFQGDKHLFEVFHKLGEIETQDILTTLRYLKDKLSYIDEEKIAFWGKGYGGFLTISLLISDPGIQCGIAVSPITNWRHYVSAFSERYMGMPWPNDNYVNYERTDLLKKAKLLRGKTFLLIHGTTDDVVSVQHSMLFMKSLIEHGVTYRTQFYPDCGILESWESYNLLHFYRTMEDFFAECFQEDVEDLSDSKVKGGSKGDKKKKDE